MNDSERIKALTKYLKISNNQLGKFIGDSNGSRIQNVLKGRNGISSALSVKLKKRFPFLNSEWLISGNGEMLSVTNIHPEIVFEEAKKSFTIALKQSSEEIYYFSIEAFSSAVGVETITAEAWIEGLEWPHIAYAAGIAKYFNLDIDQILIYYSTRNFIDFLFYNWTGFFPKDVIERTFDKKLKIKDDDYPYQDALSDPTEATEHSNALGNMIVVGDTNNTQKNDVERIEEILKRMEALYISDSPMMQRIIDAKEQTIQALQSRIADLEAQIAELKTSLK